MADVASSTDASVSAVSSDTQSSATENATDTSAGADSPESQSTAVEGADGAETTDTTSQEGAEGATEGNKSHKVTLEERAAQIADKIVQERIAEAEQRRLAEAQAQPDFIPVDYVAYDNHIAGLIAAERQLQDEIAIGTDNPQERVALVRDLRKIQQQRAKLESDFEANEQKRAQWEEKNQLTAREQAFQQQTQEEINRVVAQIPKIHGITPEALEAGRKYINEAFQKDPALQQKFDAIVTHRAGYQGFSGVTAAVEWAISYAQENMGKAAEAARQQRESGKEKTVGAASGATGTFGSITSFDELMKLPSAQINQFAKEHPQKFANLKAKRFK